MRGVSPTATGHRKLFSEALQSFTWRKTGTAIRALTLLHVPAMESSTVRWPLDLGSALIEHDATGFGAVPSP